MFLEMLALIPDPQEEHDRRWRNMSAYVEALPEAEKATTLGGHRDVLAKFGINLARPMSAEDAAKTRTSVCSWRAMQRMDRISRTRTRWKACRTPSPSAIAARWWALPDAASVVSGTAPKSARGRHGASTGRFAGWFVAHPR